MNKNKPKKYPPYDNYSNVDSIRTGTAEADQIKLLTELSKIQQKHIEASDEKIATLIKLTENFQEQLFACDQRIRIIGEICGQSMFDGPSPIHPMDGTEYES